MLRQLQGVLSELSAEGPEEPTGKSEEAATHATHVQLKQLVKDLGERADRLTKSGNPSAKALAIRIKEITADGKVDGSDSAQIQDMAEGMKNL